MVKFFAGDGVVLANHSTNKCVREWLCLELANHIENKCVREPNPGLDFLSGKSPCAKPAKAPRQPRGLADFLPSFSPAAANPSPDVPFQSWQC